MSHGVGMIYKAKDVGLDFGADQWANKGVPWGPCRPKNGKKKYLIFFMEISFAAYLVGNYPCVGLWNVPKFELRISKIDMQVPIFDM